MSCQLRNSSMFSADELKPVWAVSQVGLIGMAWSGVGQLDATLTEQQMANSYFVSFLFKSLKNKRINELTHAVVLCLSGVLVFYFGYPEMVPRFHSTPYR